MVLLPPRTLLWLLMTFNGLSIAYPPTSAHWLDTRCRPYPGGCLLGVLAREPGRPFCEDEGYDILVATIALSSNLRASMASASLDLIECRLSSSTGLPPAVLAPASCSYSSHALRAECPVTTSRYNHRP
ncbi:hypothetical protein IWX49DRAFT_386696 [Phyllosticta citricarpa]